MSDAHRYAVACDPRLLDAHGIEVLARDTGGTSMVFHVRMPLGKLKILLVGDAFFRRFAVEAIQEYCHDHNIASKLMQSPLTTTTVFL